jgi:EAL domain-containing protein (putative c-di-GMP-specific phosphodiesterase class I)/ActR/RegA family two-component response regulator
MSRPQTVESGPSRPCILIAEDDPAMLQLLTELLTESGYRTIGVRDGKAAIERLRGTDVDIVLTDILMPGASGVDVLRGVRERNLDTPVILITGNPSVPTAVEALKLGALSYLMKPVTATQLLAEVGAAWGLARLTRLRREAQKEVGAGSGFMADRAGLEAVFARAVAGMWMAYQPLVWASGGGVFGQEALLRTDAADVGSASAFLNIAERLGRMSDLGRVVRDTVARDIDGLQGAVLVNLHPSEMMEIGLTSDALFGRAERVIIEITERASLESVYGLRDTIRRLRERGFRIAIDDLGSGYAALSSFASLEPDMVKLDMSLIRGIESHPTKRKLAASMCALCRDLGILVVAEGIETEAERDVLVGLGCDLLQGFLLGRPARRARA